MSTVAKLCLAGFLSFFLSSSVLAQYRIDPTWYVPEQDWFLITVVSDGMYEIDFGQMEGGGFPVGEVPSSQLKLYEWGKQIPLQIVKNTPGENLNAGDKLRFYGRKNKGEREKWAWENPDKRPTRHFSLYSDTTNYWMTWNNEPSLRYVDLTSPPTNQFLRGYRDTVHVEGNTTQYRFGVNAQAELSTYNENEGYYWYNGLNLGQASNGTRVVEDDRPLTDLVLIDSAIIIRSRAVSLSDGSRTHQITLNHNIRGSIAFHPIAEYTWTGKGGGFQSGVVEGSVSPVRLINYNELQFKFNLINRNMGASATNPHLIDFDWFEYSYFRGFKFLDNQNQQSFWVRPDGQQSIRLRNLRPLDTVYVYQPFNNRFFETIRTGSDTTEAVFFDGEAAQRTEFYVATRENGFLLPVSYRKMDVSTDVLSAENEGGLIIITRKMFLSQAQTYAQYRSTQSGISVKVVDADHVWNIFGYGHTIPIALQRFVHYALGTWKTPPKSIFILADAGFQTLNSRVEPSEIPSFGYPPSDAWFAMHSSGNGDYISRIPVGRLTVSEPDQITAYLSKMNQYESQPTEYGIWQKKITLLSGGLDTGEREVLFQHNQRLGTYATNSLAAADTLLIGKRSNQPLDESNRTNLANIINNGTFLLHFFGHSSPDSWDLLTDNPENYQNKDKSSIVLSLGCYSGLFTTSQDRVISERFVFAPNAAIAFIGGSGQGEISALQAYSNQFYSALFGDTLRTLGDIELRARNYMITRQIVPRTLDIALAQNTIILGDPSLTVAYPSKPDYRFDFNPMQVSPNPTNLSDSTMNVSIRIRNLGRRPTENVKLTFAQTRPTGQSNTFQLPIAPVSVTKAVDFNIGLGKGDAGQHRFNFIIDSEDEIEEQDEFNNRYETEYNVFSTGIDLIYPTNRGNHNSVNPLFVVSTPTAFNQENIQIQVDTLPDFSTPVASTTFQSDRINIQWRPAIKLKKNRTYYWRARILNDQAPNFRTAQFYVDTTLTGTWWIQQKQEFEENSMTNSLLFQDSTFAFNTVELDIRTSTISWRTSREADFENYPASTFVNGEQMSRLDISFFMLVINGVTGEIRNGIDFQGIPRGQHYNVHPGIFGNDGALSRNQFIADLNAVRPGDYVILRVRNFRLIEPSIPIFTSSSDPLLAALRSVGGFKAGGGVNGNRPTQLRTTDGYILFGKKFASPQEYDPTQVSEYIISNGILEADTSLTFLTSVGEMMTPLIGPVKRWKQLSLNGDRVSATGKIIVDVLGLESPISTPRLVQTVNPSGLQSTFSSTLAGIDSERYPYVQLRARLQNEDRKTPQIFDWRLEYDPLPEVALDPFAVVTSIDSLEEGFPYNFRILVRNLGLNDIDTVIVEYVDVFQPEQGNQIVTIAKRDTIRNLEWFNKPINRVPVTVRESKATLSTAGKIGNHQLQIRIADGFRDQFTYNNVFSRNFKVTPDSTPPKIEVFFDNRFIPPVQQAILNKDNPNLPFVSGKPAIDIYWNDANPFLRIQDSTSIRLRLFSTNPNNFVEYRAGDPEMMFVPAKNSGRNEAYVRFEPDFTGIADTVFTLQVLGSDIAGNLAENEQNGYLVSFRVKSESGISSFYPYPNPMSNFTNFAFELQGEDVSQIEHLTLKVYTLSGRPIKTVDLFNNQNLLNDGVLRIGWNIYRWDGRDDDGDPLASGVYLYSVDLRANGKQIEVNNQQSVEKLVIIR